MNQFRTCVAFLADMDHTLTFSHMCHLTISIYNQACEAKVSLERISSHSAGNSAEWDFTIIVLTLLTLIHSEPALQDRRDVDLKDRQARPRQGSPGRP